MVTWTDHEELKTEDVPEPTLTRFIVEWFSDIVLNDQHSILATFIEEL